MQILNLFFKVASDACIEDDSNWTPKKNGVTGARCGLHQLLSGKSRLEELEKRPRFPTLEERARFSRYPDGTAGSMLLFMSLYTQIPSPPEDRGPDTHPDPGPWRSRHHNWLRFGLEGAQARGHTEGLRIW
jgi:hypothetical protein